VVFFIYTITFILTIFKIFYLLIDYSSAGSLYTIILSILQFKRSARLRRIDFQNPLKLSLHLKILDKVEESLIEKVNLLFTLKFKKKVVIMDVNS
jgi:hypothetical protein